MQSEMDLHVIEGLRKRIKELDEENTELAIKWGECGEQKNRYREALEKIANEEICIESEDYEQAARNHWNLAKYLRQQAIDALDA